MIELFYSILIQDSSNFFFNFCYVRKSAVPARLEKTTFARESVCTYIDSKMKGHIIKNIYT